MTRSQHQSCCLQIEWLRYRPFEVQAFMADKFPEHVENGYVSHPSEGIATHVRGIAIDLTLIDKNGKDLDMGTGFDEMSEESHHGSKEISANKKDAEKNKGAAPKPPGTPGKAA